MELVQAFILWAFAFTAVSGSHMQGGTISFKAKEKHPDGWTVDFKYKSAFIDSYGYYFYWYCISGDCGYEIDHRFGSVDNETSYPSPWYQYEGHTRRRVYNDKPFELWEYSCCWVWNNNYGYGSWLLSTLVDLGIRSDTNMPNISPVTSIIPVIRIPQNCAATINLLAHDPDGDTVRCRYGYYYGECAGCSQTFYIDQSRCTLSVPSWMGIGSYSVELVLEDFPKQDIRLTYKDGTVIYKYRIYNRKRREVSNAQENYWYKTTSDDTEVSALETEAVTFTPIANTDIIYATAITDYITDSIIESNRDYTTYPATDTIADSTTCCTTESTTDSTTEIFTCISCIDLTTTVTVLPTISVEQKTDTFTHHFDTTDYLTINMDPLSKIPLQFLVEVTRPAPSCTPGEYIPIFLPPTPNHGEQRWANVGHVFQLHLSAHAIYESVTDFKISGPSGITKSLTSISGSITKTMIVEWTPREEDLGDRVIICFIAVTSNLYQSAMRCIIVIVEPDIFDFNVTCRENTMTVIHPKTPNNELYEQNFRLNDPQCLVSSNSTHLIASVGYNSCGTETVETDTDIVFRNWITSFDDINSVITRNHSVLISFNCSFPKKNRLSASFHAQKRIYEFDEAGFGNFAYKFQFYTDDRFVALVTDFPVDVVLRELLYMEIQVSSTVPNVQLFVESCRATPHDDPNDPIFYDIIKNGCEKDDTLVVYPGTRTQYRFSLEAFAFIGKYEDVYISCTVILCKDDDPNARCYKGCITNGYRRRRSLASESQQHFISQGPLRMKRQSPSNAVEITSLNMNTLVIALSAVVIVALVAVIAHTYMKRARTTGYERLETQDI